MTGRAVIQGVAARALCAFDCPCPRHQGEAADVVAALVLAGYLQTGDGAVAPGGGSPPSAGAVSTAPSSPDPDGAHNALCRSTHDALCSIREAHGKCQVPDPLPFFDDVTAKILTALTNAGYTLTKTGGGAGDTPPATSAVPPALAGEAIGSPAPSSPQPRRFALYRHEDPSGVSGTGWVAEGVAFTDGAVALRWPGEHPCTVPWDSIERIIAVHGHGGLTEIVWLDGAE